MTKKFTYVIIPNQVDKFVQKKGTCFFDRKEENMELNKEQEIMLSGKKGKGRQKAMEILFNMARARGATRMVKISYAHLMPPDVMFFPYGKQGKWARDLTEELTSEVDKFQVPTTIEPKFVDLGIARELGFPSSIIEEMQNIMEPAAKFYESLGVIPTYSALPFYVYPGTLGQHVSIAESISILWYNTIFGSRCERDDGVTSLCAAITGYVPYAGVHLPENRFAEVVVYLQNDICLEKFTDADYDALSLAASRKTKEKIPAFVGLPSRMGLNQLKHFLAPIAVESGLALLHIVGHTPEAPTLKIALGKRASIPDVHIGRKEIDEAYDIACTATDPHIDCILLGCPHLTLLELREIAEVLQGKKIHRDVKFIAVTTRLFLQTAEEMGYASAIREAGGIITADMCIAFSGTQLSGTIATNSIKGAFFYSGFSSTHKRKVWFGSTRDCAKSAITGKWEGKR